LGGTNLFHGVARDGEVDTGAHVLHVADHEIAGPVLVTVRPVAISVHLARPEGSFRNAWPTTVARVEEMGHRVRLLTGAPLPVAVEVTSEARAELALRPGSEIWVAVKATEIGVEAERATVVG
jgi:molybdopterin-binding protein